MCFLFNCYSMTHKAGPAQNGMPIMYVCPQVGDYAANKHALHELQHEAAMYKHLRGEQGVSVPRFVACGFVRDSTMYFIATELLGPSLASLPLADGETLEATALHALQRVHACGVLHR